MNKYVNLDYLNSVVSGDEKVKREIIEMFFTQVDELSEALKTALTENDYEKISFSAHTLKSTLRIMGIENIAQKMEILQNLSAKKESPEEYSGLINYFLENIPFAISELKEVIK